MIYRKLISPLNVLKMGKKEKVVYERDGKIICFGDHREPELHMYSDEEMKERKSKQLGLTCLIWGLGVTASTVADILHNMGFNVFVSCLLPGIPICVVVYWVSLKYLGLK